MRWKYQLLSFNTVFYREDVIGAEINKLGKEGWEAVSMVLLENQWTRILFKRKDQIRSAARGRL